MNHITKLIIFQIMPGIIITSGLIGNIISFIVYSTKSFKKLSVNLFFRFLAITDSINLLIYSSYIFGSIFQKDFQIVSNSTCKIYFYVSFTFPSMSIFTLILLSIDRAICVLYPNRGFLRKKKIQILSIVVLTLYNMLFYVSVGLSYKLTEIKNETFCICQRRIPCEFIKWFDVFNSTILPFVVMIICSAITITTVIKSKNRIKTHNASTISTLSQCMNKKVHIDKNIQFACTSFGLNLTFLVFNLPISVYQLKHYKYIEDGEILEAEFYSISELFFYAHFALPFGIYYIFNFKFRSELYNLFKRKKRHFNQPSSKPSNSHF